MKKVNQLVSLSLEEVKIIGGGHQSVGVPRSAYPILVIDEEEDHCPITNPDGSFNKDSGWCGSGPGGQGIYPF